VFNKHGRLDLVAMLTSGPAAPLSPDAALLEQFLDGQSRGMDWHGSLLAYGTCQQPL
jgi:hypothetical protein